MIIYEEVNDDFFRSDDAKKASEEKPPSKKKFGWGRLKKKMKPDKAKKSG